MNNTEALTLTPKRLFSPLGGKWINLYCDPLNTYRECDGIYYEQMGYAITTNSTWMRFRGHIPCYGISIAPSELNVLSFDFEIIESFSKIKGKGGNDRYVIELPLEVNVADWIKREKCKEIGCKDYNSCNLLQKLENNDIIQNDGTNRYVQIVYKIEFDKENQATISDFLNMDIEFGQNEDQNLVSTIMGIAVMNENGWSIFDANKDEITNINVIRNKNIFPIYIMPATDIRRGDLIKESGEYYYVTEVYNHNIIAVNAKTGEMKAIKPHRDVRGKKYYVKLTSFMDFLDFGGDSNLLKMMMLMNKDK